MVVCLAAEDQLIPDANTDADMKKENRRALTGWPVLVLAAGLGVSSCKRAVPAMPVMPPPLVEVARPLKADVPMMAESIGRTEAVASVEVRARVEATVEKILFTDGTEVKEGDPLFLLDRKPIEQRVEVAKGNLGQVEAALAQTKLDVERLKPLAKVGAVPRKDLDQATSAQAQAQAAVESAKASLRGAEIDLGYTVINAPVSGIIGSKQVDLGALVGKGEPTVMATISPVDPIWASLDVSEVAYLNGAERLGKGGDTMFSAVLANGVLHPHLGKLVFLDRTVNAATGTIKLRVEFPNPGKVLRPGQFLRVRALLRTLPGALLVPEYAVVELQGRENVFVVGAEGKVEMRAVKTGLHFGSLCVVTEGLGENDQVIIEGVQKVRSGVVVTVAEGKVDESALNELRAKVPGAVPGGEAAPKKP